MKIANKFVLHNDVNILIENATTKQLMASLKFYKTQLNNSDLMKYNALKKSYEASYNAIKTEMASRIGK